MPEDRRLIEDYLRILVIGSEVPLEKSVRKGRISTLHLWRAWRPLVACRAAVCVPFAPMSPLPACTGPAGHGQEWTAGALAGSADSASQAYE
jgi:putative DNA methylase